MFSSLPKVLWICVLLFPGLVRADIVHLTDGSNFEGTFESVEGGTLVFATPGGRKVRIAGERVKRIEILYTGISACLVLRESPEQKDCNGILHTLTPSRVILARDDRRQQKEVIPLSDVKLLEFKKKDERQQILPLLRQGIRVTLLLGTEEVEGLVEQVSPARAVLLLPGGRRRTIVERDVRGGTYQPPRTYDASAAPRMPSETAPVRPQKTAALFVDPRRDPYQAVFNLWAFLPGASHFRRGHYWYGGGYVLGFLALAGAGYAEYQAAQSVSGRAQGDILFLFFNDASYRAEFHRHQVNQRIAGGVAGLLYIVQLFHAGFFRLEPVPGGFERLKRTATRPVWFVDSTLTREGERRARAGFEIRF